MSEQVHPSAERLETRLEFETLIADTSASLFATPPDQLDLAVENALERVRKFFQVDRSVLLSVSDDQQVVNVRLASYADGIPSVPKDVNLAQVFPWSRRTLLVERRPVRISRRADLPADETVERDAWTQLPIQSALTLPIETRGSVNHLVLLNTLFEEREWPDAFVTRLRVLGELLVGALERQKMLVELREAEERINLAADSAEAGLWTLNFRTGTFWVSDRTRAIFGFTPAEVVDLARLEAVVHPEDWDLVRETIERSSRSPEFVNAEYRIIVRENRDVRWLSSRGRPWFTSTGEPERLMGVSIDITERMLAQEALRQSEARLVSGTDLAELAFHEIDYQVGAVYADDRFIERCGFPPDQQRSLQGVEFWLEHLHPEDREIVLEQRRQLHDGRLNQISVEYRYLHPIQGLRWFHHLARASGRDDAGRVTATLGVLRDITTQKQAEDDLRDLSRRLIRAQEEERALLARELHDDVTQRLAVLAIDLGRAEIGATGGAQTEVMQAVREELVRLSEDIHSLAYHLHPSVLEELGLVEALRTECERRVRQGRIDLSVDLDPLPFAVGKDEALCLFRVAQEALNNVVRHAGARVANVTLRQMDGGLLLAVRDDGVGFAPENQNQERRLGLASMRERMRLVNGTLDIESAPGQGTTVVAWIPAGGAAP